MSGAAARLQAAISARLAGVAGFSGVYDGPPLQAAFPYAVVEAGPESDWGHKSGPGVEARLGVTIRDAGERPLRLHALIDSARAALEADLDVEGWQLVALRWERTRCIREGRPAPGGVEAQWVGAIDYRARLLRED